VQQRHHAHAHPQPLPRHAGTQLQCMCLERSSLGRCGVGSSMGGPQTSWKDECKSVPWSALESGGHRTSISSCLLLPAIHTNKYVRASAWAALRWREKDERKGQERKGQDKQRGIKGVSSCARMYTNAKGGSGKTRWCHVGRARARQKLASAPAKVSQRVGMVCSCIMFALVS
jgi:hypothetical protein